MDCKLGRSKTLSFSKVRRLEAMERIKQMMIEGKELPEIRETIGVSNRTLERYINRLYDSERETMMSRNHYEQNLERQIILLKNRYVEQLQLLREMVNDPTLSPSERLNTIGSMRVLSETLAKLYRDGPLSAVIQQKKMEELQNQTLYLNSNGTSTVTRDTQPALNSYSETPFPPLHPHRTADNNDSSDQQDSEVVEEEEVDPKDDGGADSEWFKNQIRRNLTGDGVVIKHNNDYNDGR